ncbi:hypothetical protein ACOSP7_013365 [Xanthoceras sorbifolium]
MEQPSGFESFQFPQHVCKLKKAFYRLKQAPRAWFNKLKTALLSWGFSNSKSDVSLFIKRAGSVLLYVLIYVDDILITGTDLKQIHHTIFLLNWKFALKTLGSVGYFLGFEAFRNSQGIYLTQTKYIFDLLTKTNLLNSKPYDTPICSSVKLSLNSGQPFKNPTLYYSTFGALQYLTYTRPNIAFSVNKLSQFLAVPNDVH